MVVMESRPGRIRSIIDVAIPRPRSAEIRVRDALFLDLKQEILGLLGHVAPTAGRH